MSAVSAQRSDDASYERNIAGVRIEQAVHGLRITRSWSRAAGFVMLGWVAVWFGVVAFFSSLGQPPPAAFQILRALPGLAMFYVALGWFFNRTVIVASPSEIVLQHGPLPWLGNRRFDARDINSLQVKIRTIQYRGYSIDVCWIFVVRADGRRLRLMKESGMSEGQMSVIGAALSDYLRIPVFAETEPPP